jgi:hypothetical protein
MKVVLKNFLSFSILFISIYLIYYYLNSKDYITFFTKLSLFEWIIISTLGWLIMILTTLITFGLRIPDKKKSIKEILTYPLMQNLWGYLIPFQGSIIFSLYYFKRTHNLSVLKSLSVNLIFLFISIILTGILFDQKQANRVLKNMKGYESHLVMTDRISKEEVIEIQKKIRLTSYGIAF